MDKIKIFISYSWDDDTHKKWVWSFSEFLQKNGFDVIIDKKDLINSRDINNFMEIGIDDSDTIIIICTPAYKEKADKRSQNPEKGVAYESRIIAELTKSNKSIIPIIFDNPENSIPIFAKSMPYILWDKTKNLLDTDNAFLELREKILSASPKKSKKYIRINREFLIKLNDVGLLNVQHEKLSLEDIFIYPRLSSMDGDIKSIQQVNLYASQIIKDRGIYVISGKNQYGKSSYSKKLFLDFFNEGFFPILIFNDKVFSKLGDNPESLLKVQYDGMLSIDDDIREKQILIIDDFHKLNTGKQNSLSKIFKDFFAVIVFTDDIFELNLKKREIVSSMRRFQIKEFSPSMRSELIKKWIKANYHEPSCEMDYVALVDEKTSLIEKTLGKSLRRGIMPSIPFFIISIISSADSFDISQQREITSQGHCYQALIFLCLKSIGIKNIDIDTYINFMTELSNYFYEQKTSEITQESLESFISSYKVEYNLNIKEEDLLRNLLQIRLLRKDSLGMYTFYYPYIFYYFMGKYISENLKKSKHKIEDIMNNLHLEKNSYICIFLIHHNKDDDIMDEIKLNAMCLFDDIEPSTLFLEELTFFNTEKNPIILEALPHIEKDYKEYREDRLAKEDLMEESIEENEEELLYLDDSEDDYSDVEKELKKSIHTAEVIGTIVKNRAGSLKKETIENLIKEGIDIHFRFMKKILCSIEDEELKDILINLIVESIEESNEGENSNILKDKRETKKIAEELLIKLGYYMLISIFSITTHLIGSKEVISNIDNVCNKNASPAFIIIKHLNKMRYGKTININEIYSDIQNCKFSFLTNNILNYFIVEYCSIHPISYPDRQRISKKLNIPMKNLIPPSQNQLD